MNHIESLELSISRFLRLGVIVSGLMMLAGWLFSLDINSDPFFIYQIHDPLPLQDMLQLHWKNDQWPVLISYLGLALLILLPLTRVLLTGILFLRQGEKLLSLIALMVLLFLILSFSLGIEL